MLKLNTSCRPPSRSTRMSGWPCVTSSAVRAVVPVTMALIARVVPWINMLPRPSSLARVSPVASAAACRLSRTPMMGSCGVVCALNMRRLPSSSSTTRSVKVPPVSTANRILCLFGDHIALRVRSALARALQELCEGGTRAGIAGDLSRPGRRELRRDVLPDIKLAAEAGMPPLAYAFWQSALSGLGLLAIAAIRGCRVPLEAGALKAYFLVGVLGLCPPGALLTFTAPHLPAGLVTLVLALSPPLTFLMAAPAPHQPFPASA